MKFHIVTLGCPKNEVDSEGMEVLLTEAGHCPVDELSEADLIVVNTCGFIDAAKAESVETLKSVSDRRRPGSLLVAAGCLAQREGEGLSRQVAGLDAIIGCRNWPDITKLAEQTSRPSRERGAPVPVLLEDRLQLGAVRRRPRSGSAYVKISDGCDAACAFCAIPAIKGGHQSKPADQVIAEVRQLAEGGVREVVLVGQDTTAYGLDLGDREGLEGLLRRIAEDVPQLPWIRLLYLYPQRITPGLLQALAELPQLCKYVDIPLQHTHPTMLRRMRRPHGEVSDLIESIRTAVPEVAIRTTFIVGFPGETEEEHHHLLRSIEELGIDRVGVFAYSPQDGTAAAAMPDQVDEATRQRRWREAMEVAQRVSLKRNRRMVGRTLEVLVEGAEEGARGRTPTMAGRSYRDAPEVDGLVLFSGMATMGEIVKVRVTSALEYDLVGKLIGTGVTGRRGDVSND
ncbi:MAG: 30S ribosomal protein S12 methylthiotransferase RimO [Chloroflexota bacterium]